MIKFIPSIIEEHNRAAYATFLVELTKCPICSSWMLAKPKACYETFPKYFGLSFEQQLKDAGWQEMGFGSGKHRHVCQQCISGGLDRFTCALCGKETPSSEIKESFGDPAEFLCRTCYTTKPASEWEEKTKQLYESHRYDCG